MRAQYLLLTAALLLPCRGWSQATEQAVSGSGVMGYFVTGEAAGAPPGCEIETVARRLDDLFQAINSGRSGIAEEFFGLGSDAPFQWFSFTAPASEGRDHFSVMAPEVARAMGYDYPTREQLDPHLARRHAAGDRFTLRGVHIIGWVPERGTVSLSPLLFEFHRGSGSTVYYGYAKGEYHCATSSFVVLSTGTMPASQWQVAYDRYAPETNR